jgi:thiamine-phosphate pyrophosphorylase
MCICAWLHVCITVIALSPLYAICDADVCAQAGWPLVHFAAACLDGGARLLQIRAKHVGSRELLDVCAQVVERADAYKATVVVNDRADVAAVAGAGGVHLGQDDLPPSAVRHLLAPTAMVGLSTHTPAQIDAALLEPVTYLAVGPVFGTSTKDTGYASVGRGRVRLAARAAATRGVPLVAIGGITLGRAPEVIAAGAASVAVITDLLATGDPAARVRAYLDALAV